MCSFIRTYKQDAQGRIMDLQGMKTVDIYYWCYCNTSRWEFYQLFVYMSIIVNCVLCYTYKQDAQERIIAPGNYDICPPLGS